MGADPASGIAGIVGIIVIALGLMLAVLALFIPYMIYRILVHVRAMRGELEIASRALQQLTKDVAQSLDPPARGR
jgi:hypothetical protein